MTTNVPRTRFLPALATALLAAATGAHAAEPAPLLWSADPAASELSFQFVQAGAKTSGQFQKFTADVDFSPADLAKGRIEVAIDMASADTRDKDRDSTLRTADLFDTAKFQRSTYLATNFTARGNGYEGQGKLSLRGVTRDVPITFTFEPGTDAGKPAATLTGTAMVRRLDFGIGQGEWKSTQWIGNEVQVSFSLRLVPRAGAPGVPAQPAAAAAR